MPNDDKVVTPSSNTETDDIEPSEDIEIPPMEVKIINKNEKKWNDSYEDKEYDEHIITDEEIKEHGNT